MSRTLVCAPVMVENVSDALAAGASARDAGADLVEYRLDLLASTDGAGLSESGAADAARLVAGSPLPCVATCRAADEGGLFEGDDDARVTLYERLIGADAPPRYVDIEHAACARDPSLLARLVAALDAQLERSGDGPRTGLILSAHDFEGRPADLMRLVARMRAVERASVIKIAFRARSVRDNLEVFELLRERDRPTIALAMGEAGAPSRVMAPKFGAFLTFASLTDEAATAPGQPTIAELLGTYRFRSIGPGTALYGVIGWPVAHSIGPSVHNAAFEAAGVDGAYLRLPAADSWEAFKATTLALLGDPHADFRGASVTIPHKERLLRLARDEGWAIDPLAEAIGAANTLAVTPGGAVGVSNTDAPGITGPLLARLGDGGLRGVRVAVIGAGGAARAATVGLAREGAEVVVFNRTLERAERLVADARSSVEGARVTLGEWGGLAASGARACVNCTAVGMAGGPDPGGESLLRGMFEGTPGGVLVFDTVYNPVETPVVRWARENACEVITGAEMFAVQAAAQFERWTGLEAPRALFERITNESLHPGA